MLGSGIHPMCPQLTLVVTFVHDLEGRAIRYRTVGKVSTTESVQNFSRFRSLFSTSSTDAF